jgi:DNA polymerase iota
MIDHNVGLLNQHDLEHSFFCLDKQDPTVGFAYDATKPRGPTYPALSGDRTGIALTLDALTLRLIVASHLADFIRTRLEHERAYTATVGVSTSKLLAKLVGNVNKPNNQTTLVPPYGTADEGLDVDSNVTRFMDAHEVGKVPGIGFKLAHKLRTYVLRREPAFEPYTVRDHEDQVKVGEVRQSPGMNAAKLQDILGGPGAPKDIGLRVWELLNGLDNSEVLEARSVPTQISIEDSYQGLSHFDAVKQELRILAASLIRRMRTDLTEEEEDDDPNLPVSNNESHRRPMKTRWLAHPRTIRLSTRRRSSRNADGSRDYSFQNSRVSRSAPAPTYIFNLGDSVEALAERLVEENLLSMFRKIHPDRAFGELSLINIAVTHLVETAGDQKQSSGRDIGKMLRQQESVLKDWKVSEADEQRLPRFDKQYSSVQPILAAEPNIKTVTAVDAQDAAWEESDDEELSSNDLCHVCGASIPHFALAAHALYHEALD